MFRLNEVWVSDVTYVATREARLKLAAAVDLGSRRRAGWAMRGALDVELAGSALEMAIAGRRPEPRADSPL